MSAFVSYSRRDAKAVEALHADIELAGLSAWFDREVEGGQLWWDVILERIRSCEIFVVALSPDSLASKACQAELAYAVALPADAAAGDGPAGELGARARRPRRDPGR